MIVPEDPTRDAFIIRPVIERIFMDLERRARIDVMRDPHMRGTNDVLSWSKIREAMADNAMEDLFVLVVDRDGNRKQNEEKVEAIRRHHAERLIVCLAVQEVEVWMLALHRRELDVPWAEVRAHLDPKEAFADPLLDRKGWSALVGRGRKRAMQAIDGQWRGLLQVCPEIGDLKQAIATWLDGRTA